MSVDNLIHLNGEIVTLVRPITKTQSDAWDCKLTAIKLANNTYKYNAQSTGKSTLFTMEDVVDVETRSVFSVTSVIIRLKGALDN